jgi:hypothetical protein
MSRQLSEERRKGDRLRAKVLERDGYMCRICGSEENLEVHHMLALTYGGKSTLKNLITLCADCHYYAPEKGIEANTKNTLRKRNLVIYEHLNYLSLESLRKSCCSLYGVYKITGLAFMWNLGFITEEQKEKMVRSRNEQLVRKGFELYESNHSEQTISRNRKKGLYLPSEDPFTKTN